MGMSIEAKQDRSRNVIPHANCWLDVHKATQIADSIYMASTHEELREAAHNARFLVMDLLQQATKGDFERECLLQSFEDLGADAMFIRKMKLDVKQLRSIIDCVRAARTR